MAKKMPRNYLSTIEKAQELLAEFKKDAEDYHDGAIIHEYVAVMENAVKQMETLRMLRLTAGVNFLVQATDNAIAEEKKKRYKR